jgi:hypothetical protein
MKKYLVILICIIVLTACSEGKEEGTETRATGSVSGFVTGNDSGAVVKDVRVKASGTEVTTGDDGAYEIKDIETGETIVTANKSGYGDYSSTINIANDQTTSHDIVLQASSQQSPADGLVAYYPFDGNSNDLSGNGNNGVEHGGVEYVDSDNGKALKLDGTTGYIRIPNPEQKFDSEFTIVIKMAPDLQWGQAVSKYSWNGVADGFSISINDQNGSGTPNPNENESYIHGSTYDSQPFDASNNLKYQVVRNEMIDVAYSFKDGKHNLYINGKLETSKELPSVLNLDNDYDILVGTYLENGSSIVLDSEGQGYKGLIDELSIYNRALTDSELAQMP